MESIESMALYLRLPSIRKNYQEIIQTALDRQCSYQEFLELVLRYETTYRHNLCVQKRIKAAKFPSLKTFEELDFNAFSLPVANQIRELQSLSFVLEGRNVVLVGNPGTGKTHIATALGVLACQKNYSVLYASIPNLVMELKEAMKERQIINYKKKIMTYDLLVLDELGYISFDKDGSELLFNLLSNRSEHKSTIITTNLTFDKWPSVFGDTIMATAMVDRLTNRANIISIIGESYRMKQTKEWLKSKNDAHNT